MPYLVYNMANNKDRYVDKSGDRKYFTLIPNYIVNHSNVYEQSLYLVMKRIAGEEGSCWASPTTIGKTMGVSSNTVRKYRDNLVKRGWIKKIGERGKTKPTDEFEIVDLWKLNTDFYHKKESSTGEQSQKESSTGEQIVQLVNLVSSTGGNKEEPYKKNQEEERVATEAVAIESSLIVSLIDSFRKFNPSAEKWYENKTQREACQDLIKMYTLDRVLIIVEKTLPKTNGLPYFPTITTPVQLRDKWVSLESAVRKYQSEKKVEKEKYKVAFTS